MVHVRHLPVVRRCRSLTRQREGSRERGSPIAKDCQRTEVHIRCDISIDLEVLSRNANLEHLLDFGLPSEEFGQDLVAGDLRNPFIWVWRAFSARSPTEGHKIEELAAGYLICYDVLRDQ